MIGTLCESQSQAEISECESIQFDCNLDDLKMLLQREEERIKTLEEKRIELETNIELLEKDIIAEKLNYRKAIIGMIEERDKLADYYVAQIEQDLQKSIKNLKTSESITKLKKTIEDIKRAKCDFEVDTETIRKKIVQNTFKSKQEYMNSIRAVFAANKNKKSQVK